jgi:hypothetical protein
LRYIGWSRGTSKVPTSVAPSRSHVRSEAGFSGSQVITPSFVGGILALVAGILYLIEPMHRAATPALAST